MRYGGSGVIFFYLEGNDADTRLHLSEGAPECGVDEELRCRQHDLPSLRQRALVVHDLSVHLLRVEIRNPALDDGPGCRREPRKEFARAIRASLVEKHSAIEERRVPGYPLREQELFSGLEARTSRRRFEPRQKNDAGPTIPNF